MGLVKHSELTVEQVTDIKKNLLEHAKLEPFWGKFTRHISVADGFDTFSVRKLCYKDLTTNDLTNLTEGVTPAPQKLKYVEFKKGVVNYGNWIEYTDESKKYNYDDVVRDAKSVLGDDAEQQAELRIGKVFIQTPCTITAAATMLETLLKAKTTLKKNKMKPIVGDKYVAILPDEIANQLLVDYKAQLTDTTEKNAMIEGYIGCLGGFVIYARTDDFLYHTVSSTQKGYCLFIGKSVNGLPVATTSIGDDSVEVFDNGLGSVPQANEDGSIYGDPLHQRGSVGYKRMGFGTMFADEDAVLLLDTTLTLVAKSNLADSSRDGYVRAAQSPTE